MKILSLTFAVLLVTAGVPATNMADDGRPLADAGLDQSTTVDSTVYLDGGGSVDPDGEITDYRWSIETPSGETITPADPTAAQTQFVPDEPGRYRVTLTVTGDDGQSESDTLYVDVDRSSDPPSTPSQTETPTATDTPESESTPTPEPDPEPSGGDSDAGAATNQPPDGEIRGPSSVTSGSDVTYTIDASDPDGEIVDRWWLPTSLAGSRPSQSDLRSDSRTFTADGTPGNSVELTAIVVDDDGATSTLTKTVEVRNTPPVASIEGDETAVMNTTKEYRLSATDPDGEITSVSLTSGSGAVEPTGPMPWDGATSSGEWARSFRFTEIPEDDGTVTFEATVRDEHGGVTTVEKEVTVVSNAEAIGQDPLAQAAPKILELDATLEDGPEGINERQALFSAVASDNDSERLTFEWRIGDVALLRNRAGGDPARANISYALEDQQIEEGEVDVTLWVSDQNGNERSLKKTFEVQQQDQSGGVIGRAHSVEVTRVLGRTAHGKFLMKKSHAGKKVALHFGDDHSDVITLGDTTTHRFSHKYESAGRFSISVNPQWSPDVSSAPVEVNQQTYSQFTYERNATTIHRTKAAEKPGDNWTQGEIVSIEREQVDVETMQTLAEGGKAVTKPGQEWKRVGTTTEYHTEQRTTESSTNPGGNWSVAERNVDQEQVFDGWQHMTVPQRGMLGSDWEYVETVQRTVDRTETTRSANRPSGDGWTREDQVGQTQVGYRTEWVDYRFHADADWQYIGSDRYVSGYDVTTRCVEYIQLYRTRHCVEEETERDPEYDYRYEYRVPEYDSVYEWERSIQETEYEYRYRAATYTTESVHRYEKDVRVGTEYAQWERPVIDETEIYRWKRVENSWESGSSLSKPVGDVRNVTRTIKECGTEPNEPSSCEREN